MMYRSMYGRNGADHMRLIVLAGGAASLVPGIGANVVAVCAWFIAAQVVMSYAIAGWAKLFSTDWRSGNAVIGILYTESYGTRALGVYLKKHRWLAYAACWGVIVMECLWTGFFLYDAQVALMLMIAAGLFHLASAIGMGLSDFLLAWGATYPVLWACSGRGAELVATIYEALIG
jgi:hypothetical protein